MNEADDYMRRMTLYAFPNAEPLSSGPSCFRRRWAVRVRNPLPGNDELDLIASNLVERYMKTIEEEYGELIKQKNLMKSAMNVALVRVDDLHLVAQIDLPTWDVTVGDESLIGTWMVLRELDELWQVDDMEGIPRRFWLVFK